MLLNVPHNTMPFRVGMLAPVGGGRLIRLLISPEDEQTAVVLYALGATYARVGDREHALEYMQKPIMRPWSAAAYARSFSSPT